MISGIQSKQINKNKNKVISRNVPSSINKIIYLLPCLNFQFELINSPPYIWTKKLDLEGAKFKLSSKSEKKNHNKNSIQFMLFKNA